MKNHLLTFCFFLFAIAANSQQILTNHFNLEKKATIHIDDDKWNPTLKNHILPKPDHGADNLIKEKNRDQLSQKYPKKKTFSQNKVQTIAAPVLYRNFAGNAFNGFIPNDNDLAISNNNRICSVTNTTILSKNLASTQTPLSYNLHTITSSLGLLQEEFDPKVMYDPLYDRFIFVCLNGFTDSTSNVIIGFSQTDSSNGAWNIYALPGDPLNLTLWTDFPMMALTEQEVFLTVNLLYNDSTWQAGFNQTLIWQLKKSDGFNGLPLSNNLISGINFNGQPIRNLCPVKGGSQLYGPNMQFISNRNFTTGNDTIFVVEVTDTIGAVGSQVIISPAVSTIQYHMPPYADQTFTDKLQVNDARIMGAFTENGAIQFVNNSMDTISGNGCIYVGNLIFGFAGWSCTALNYADANLDLCYPNISYAGNSGTDNRAIIGLLQSSATINPGTGAIIFDGISQFSPITTVKAGLSYINMITGTERWGDYTGNQRKYNQPGVVWISGGYGIVTNHQNRTWIGELGVDSTTAIATIDNYKSDFILFPNPGNEIITVDFLNKENQVLTFTVFDNQGKLIKKLYEGSVSKGENQFSFNMMGLNSGNYFLKISGNKQKSILSKKFVKL